MTLFVRLFWSTLVDRQSIDVDYDDMSQGLTRRTLAQQIGSSFCAGAADRGPSRTAFRSVPRLDARRLLSQATGSLPWTGDARVASNRLACHPVRSFSSNVDGMNVLQGSPFPIFTTLADFRRWRADKAAHGKRIGFVPTMGALHEGHLGLVRQSLQENDETVVSIFVNPAQFAPTEDLASYPRTLPTDVEALASLHSPSKGAKSVAAIFAPTVTEMYPSPDGKLFSQHVDQQVGAFVEVSGLQHKMEGASRPTFFRGVATVVTKLFHVVQPDLAYFGQKDIQQAILLRRMVSDLLFPHPPSAEAVRVMPTARDPADGLALSSRNAYLTKRARPHANILFRALRAGQQVWDRSPGDVQATLQAARQAADAVVQEARQNGVSLEVLYIDLNDPITLDNLEPTKSASEQTVKLAVDRGAILSGAALIRDGPDGKVTRLIDNSLLGFTLS